MPIDPTAVTADALATLEKAWNSADGTMFAEPFTEQADFVDIRGTHHRGRAAIAAGHDAIFSSIYAGSTIRYDVTDARQIGEGAVLGLVHGRLQAPRGPLAGESEATISVVMRPVDGTWRIDAFHNTLVVGG